MTVLSKFIITGILATAAPAVTDDNTKGYTPGRFWFDSTHGNLYWLKSNATGAAVWTNVSGGGGGGSVVGVAGDEVTIHVDNTDPTNPIVSILADGVDTAEIANGAVTSAKMSATGISAGSYTSVNITVDAAGRITAIANGTGGGGGSGGSGDADADYNKRIIAYASLVSFWKLNETSGTTLADSGPAANTLTLAGGGTIGPDLLVVPGPMRGAVNRALASAAAGWANNTAPSSLPTGAAARTMELWCRTKDTTAKFLLSWGTFGAATHLGSLLIANNNISGDICASNSGDDVVLRGGTAMFNDGEWHHAVMTYDGGTTIKLYFDGQLVKTQTVTAFNTTLTGRGIELWNGQGFLSPLDGALAKVAVYNAVLTDAEIKGNYNAGTETGGGLAIASTPWVGAATVINATSAAPTKGSSIAVDKMWWRRVGDTMECRLDYRQTAATGAASGTGAYLFEIPGGVHIDTAKCSVSTGILGTVGSGSLSDNSTSYQRPCLVEPYDATHVTLSDPTLGLVGSTVSALSQAFGTSYSAYFVVPIAEWASGASAGGVNLYQTTIAAEPNLAGYWKCNDAIGSSILADSTGANDLTIVAATLGLRSMLDLGTEPNIFLDQANIGAKKASPTGAIPIGGAARSLELIFKSNYTTSCFVAGYGSSGTRNAFGIGINPSGVGNLAGIVYGDDIIVSGHDVLDGFPHHVALTYDGSVTMKLYLDGQLLNTRTLGGALTTAYDANGMQIGTNIFLSTNYTGRVSDVAVYNVELSAAKILDHYKKSRAA